MSVPANRNQTIQRLAQQLRRLERAGGPGEAGDDLLSTGIGPLDELLPAGGVRPGTLIEWLSPGEGGGAAAMACAVAASAMQAGGACVVIDPSRSFIPPVGLMRSPQRPPERGLVRIIAVHPAGGRDTLWALEQSLRCSGVAVAVCWLDSLHAHAYRRLQLAAEAGGAIGLLLRPARYRSQPSWADVRLLVETLPFDCRCGPDPPPGTAAFPAGRLLRIELVHCRGRAAGDAVELEIDDETGDVRLAPQLAARSPRAG